MVYGSSHPGYDGNEGVDFPSIILYSVKLVGHIWCVFVQTLGQGIYHDNM